MFVLSKSLKPTFSGSLWCEDIGPLVRDSCRGIVEEKLYESLSSEHGMVDVLARGISIA
jgi:hypothetical protein